MNIAKCCYCALAVITIPFQTAPCLESVNNLVEKIRLYYKENFYLPLNSDENKATSFTLLYDFIDTAVLSKFGTTATLLVVTYALAMSAIRIDFLLALVGATGGTVISFLFPTLVYCKLYPEEEYKTTRSIAIVMTVISITSGVFYIVSLILR